MNELTWLIIASVFAIVPILLIKQYNVTEEYIYIYLTLASYVILTICYINVFKKDISYKYTFMQITQILIVTIFGIFVFGEPINYNKILGIFFGIMCVYLLFEKYTD
jgi:multidrug transporter EmrE-like cation transporter